MESVYMECTPIACWYLSSTCGTSTCCFLVYTPPVHKLDSIYGRITYACRYIWNVYFCHLGTCLVLMGCVYPAVGTYATCYFRRGGGTMAGVGLHLFGVLALHSPKFYIYRGLCWTSKNESRTSVFLPSKLKKRVSMFT